MTAKNVPVLGDIVPRFCKNIICIGIIGYAVGDRSSRCFHEIPATDELTVSAVGTTWGPLKHSECTLSGSVVDILEGTSISRRFPSRKSSQFDWHGEEKSD